MRFLRHVGHLCLRKIGYDTLRYTEHNFVGLRKAHILKHLGINLVLDIGAHEGSFALDLRESGYAGRIICFEPLPQAFKLLEERASRDENWTCDNLAIGDYDGEGEINVSKHKTSSSLLGISELHTKAMPASAYMGKEKVRVARLDSALKAILDTSDRVYLKADVQGYEKHVLLGAVETLKQTAAIEIELSMARMYEQAPLYHEMINYLEGLGFGLVSIEGVFTDPNTGYLLQADGIFVKRL